MPEPDDPYCDLPITQALESASQLIAKGFIVYFKFTCKKCGSRQFFNKSNSIYKEYKCSKCGYVNNIKKLGYAVMYIL